VLDIRESVYVRIGFTADILYVGLLPCGVVLDGVPINGESSYSLVLNGGY
jgi:hypothetical protein